jgi:hypothetical protein
MGHGDQTERQQHWDAGLYDARHAFVWQHGASLVDLLAPRPGELILDLGQRFPQPQKVS